jgi:hypothetical protein
MPAWPHWQCYSVTVPVMWLVGAAQAVHVLPSLFKFLQPFRVRGPGLFGRGTPEPLPRAFGRPASAAGQDGPERAGPDRSSGGTCCGPDRTSGRRAELLPSRPGPAQLGGEGRAGPAGRDRVALGPGPAPGRVSASGGGGCGPGATRPRVAGLPAPTLSRVLSPLGVRLTLLCHRDGHAASARAGGRACCSVVSPAAIRQWWTY